ncbi:MAG: YceD family protein [Saprospiraceae bacterium]
MDPFLAYSIPVQGLKLGIHRYEYTLDSGFFSHFENSPIEEGEVKVVVELDKRPSMLLLDFVFDGYSHAECDRCTASIRLPIRDERPLVIKYGEAEGEDDADEVVFISREASALQIAPYLYEFSILALPITNTYNCQDDQNPPCNFDVLKLLEKNTETSKPDPVWDALDGLK